jgi:hypothetical protein
LNGSQFYKKIIPKYGVETDKRRNANRTRKGQLDPREVPSFDQINAMNPVEAKKFIEDLIQKYTIQELRAHWALSEFLWNKRIVAKFDIDTNTKKKEVIEVPTIIEPQKSSQEAFYLSIIDDYNRMLAEKAKDVDGFKLTLNGEYYGETIERKLLKLVDTLDHNARYKLKYEIVELEELKKEEKEEKPD